MPVTIAQLQAVITADVSGFTSGMNDAKQKIDEVKDKGEGLKASAKSLGDAFTNLGATLTASLTAPITAAAALGISFVDLKQKSLLAFQTMIGSTTQAQNLFNQLQQFAAATPFDLPGVVKGSQRLMAMGVAAKNVIPYMRILGDTTAAVGGSQATLDEITSVIGKMSASATLTTHRLNELAAAGVPIWDIMAKQMGTTVDKVREQVESGAVSSQHGVEMILTGLDKRFGGLMAKMGDTWSVTVSNLQDSAQQALGSLFEPAINSATKFLQTVSEKLFQAKAVFESMPASVRQIIVVLLGVAAAAGPVMLAVGGMMKAWTAISGVIEVVGGLLSAEILVPLAIVAAAIAAFALAYRSNFMGVRDITNYVMKIVGNQILDVIAVFIAFGKDVFAIAQNVGKTLTAWSQQFLHWVHTNAIIQEVGALWSKVWNWISGEVRAHGQQILNVINAIVAAVPGLGQAVIGIENAINSVSAKDGGFWNQVAGARSDLDKMVAGAGAAMGKLGANFKMPGMPTFSKGSGGGKTDDGADKKAQKAQDQFVAEMKKQQLVLRLLRQGETKDLADLAAQYGTISLARVRELQGVDNQIKSIEDEREKRKSLSDSIKSSYASVRDAVLKARDGSEQNTIAVDIYHTAYAKLTAAQKAAIAPTIALTVEQNRLNAAHEAAKKAAEDAAEARKKATEEFASQSKSAYDALEKSRLAMVSSAGATDVEKVAISQFNKELSKLSPAFRWIAEQIAHFDAVTADNTAITERTKEIAKLTAQYRDALAGASDFDRFLTEKGVDKGKSTPAGMKSWHDLFDADQLRDQGKQVDQMRTELQRMGSEFLHVSGATEEARLSLRYFGRDIDTLAPDVQAQIRKMAPDFKTLEAYKKYRETVAEVGGQIKGVFESAFESVLTKSGNFFKNLIAGFKQMLVKMAAEWAAAAVVKFLISLFDKQHQGLTDDAAKAAKNMVTGATAIGAAAALLDKAAKDTKDAADSMASGAIGGVGAGGGGAATGLLGLGGKGGAGGLLGSGFTKILPYLGAGELADQLLFKGAITKGFGKILGGGLKHLFHFAEGAWNVPGSSSGDHTPAMLQGGEMVVPRKFAEGIREGGHSGLFGGGDTHFGQGGTVIINDRADAARIAATVRAKRQAKFRLK